MLFARIRSILTLFVWLYILFDLKHTFKNTESQRDWQIISTRALLRPDFTLPASRYGKTEWSEIVI